MVRPSLTLVLSGIFVAYILHSVYTLYGLFHPPACPPGGQCIKSYLARNPQLDLYLYTSTERRASERSLRKLLVNESFNVHDTVEHELNVTLPLKTVNNGSLYVHAFVCPHGQKPFQALWNSQDSALLTSYMVPRAESFNLIGSKEEKEAPVKSSSDRDRPVTHWRSRLTFSVMTDDILLDRMSVPGEIARYLRVNQQREYLPIVYIDQLSNRIRDLLPVNTSVDTMPLTLTYQPISVGKLRMWVSLYDSFQTMYTLGFTEKDTDEMKGIFADTNFYFLMLTFVVAAVHLLFDFLAFKNDISYWKNRDSMVGLSTRVVVWRCVSTIIIFLYLWDEETSLLVLIPAGVGAVIEVWKVKKAFKVSVAWSGWKPSFQIGTTSDKEKETEEFDSQAMKYLSYVLYPLCAVGAVYSLIYTPHKSWYSWCIQCLVNGVYAFGFLFMLPQLFVNYKLKSVAHLPWRAFMYKAFNTFIDDIFAFIITMPTAHRLACFRDDIVFLIYLYQRWLYPVDKTRVNEFGQSFEEDSKMKDAVKGSKEDGVESKKKK